MCKYGLYAWLTGGTDGIKEWCLEYIQKFTWATFKSTTYVELTLDDDVDITVFHLKYSESLVDSPPFYFPMNRVDIVVAQHPNTELILKSKTVFENGKASQNDNYRTN